MEGRWEIRLHPRDPRDSFPFFPPLPAHEPVSWEEPRGVESTVGVVHRERARVTPSPRAFL